MLYTHNKSSYRAYVENSLTPSIADLLKKALKNHMSMLVAIQTYYSSTSLKTKGNGKIAIRIFKGTVRHRRNKAVLCLI